MVYVQNFLGLLFGQVLFLTSAENFNPFFMPVLSPRVSLYSFERTPHSFSFFSTSCQSISVTNDYDKKGVTVKNVDLRRERLVVPHSKLAFRRPHCRRTSGLKSLSTSQPKLNKNVNLFFRKIASANMYKARFDKNAHDKNVAWRWKLPRLAQKVCVLRNASLLWGCTEKWRF